MTPRAVQIGNTFVGDGWPIYVIAEIGINHNGSLDNAKQLIEGAHRAGADAVKFRKVIGVESFAEIYANKFDAVMAKLNLKARKPQ